MREIVFAINISCLLLAPVAFGVNEAKFGKIAMHVAAVFRGVLFFVGFSGLPKLLLAYLIYLVVYAPSIGERIVKIKKIFAHKKQFLKVEKRILGRVSIDGVLHDLDKAFMTLFLPMEWVKPIHQRLSRHHITPSSSIYWIRQAVIDWECSGATSPDFPWTAREYLAMFRKDLIGVVNPVMRGMGL